MTNCVWKLSKMSNEIRSQSRIISNALGIPLLVAELMVQRGIGNVEDAEAFLRADLSDLQDPFLLADMEKAVTRLIQAIKDGEKIRVYGDYDVDGITSICVVMDVLNRLGAEVDYYIPDRIDEGYGMNPEAITGIAKDGVSLLITVDCGITASREVELARSLGMDVIITDHHEPHGELPGAVAVINPKRQDDKYPFRDLAGVGVAYKLVHALLMATEGTLDVLNPPCDLLDLVALGTIADVCPLTGENRIYAKQGLAQMERTENLGLKALIDVCGLTDREITAGRVGFVIAPRLNAAGRIRDASLCVELLTTDSQKKAMKIAEFLNRVNQERQALEQRIFDEAFSMVETCDGEAVDSVLVLANEGWHPGVIGIVASRLVEQFNRPTIMIAIDGDEGRGSGRSIPAFDLYKGLTDCRGSLLRFGGHKHAAGIAVSRDAIDVFRQEINEVGRSVLDEDDFLPKIVCDQELTLDEIDLEVAKSIAMLAPFGVANPTPLLLSTEVGLLEYRGVGANGRHLKLKLFQNGVIHDGIGFGLGHFASQLYSRHIRDIDLIYSIEVNEWNGLIQPQLNVKGIRATESRA